MYYYTLFTWNLGGGAMVQGNIDKSHHVLPYVTDRKAPLLV